MVTHSDFLAWKIPALEPQSYPPSALSPQMRHANVSVGIVLYLLRESGWVGTEEGRGVVSAPLTG